MRNVSLLFAGFALMASTAFAGDGTIRRSDRRIPGRYVVVLEAGSDLASVANHVRNFRGARVRHTYQKGVKGFALELSAADAATLARDVRVRYVEEDAVVSAASWGLDRIDQRVLPLDGSAPSSSGGAGVAVYLVDTGVASDHGELAGRVSEGFTAFEDGNGSSDCNGHGTHVAGIVAGSTFGVAKAASIIPVRVLDCNGAGTVSTVLAGLDWILEQHAASPVPAVVNMSLSGGLSSAVDSAVDGLVAAGLTTVVAAGNASEDACRTSPARVPGALTVGASTETDARAAFSNFGPCVDLFAPGTNIMSAWYADPSESTVSSGTSSAAPFVSGVAALWLESFPDATPAAIAESINSHATVDVLTDAGAGSLNRLLYAPIGDLEQPTGDVQLFADPGFEYGTTFWSSEICTVVKPTGCTGFPTGGSFYQTSFPSRTGNGHDAIGGPANSFLVSSEPLTLPLHIGRAELSVHVWIVTKNKKRTVADTLTIEIRDADGILIDTLATYSNRDATPAYVLRRFDVSKYRGQTIRISFAGMQSQGPPTWFLLDDAALNVWR
jgi:hypothetical protein